MESFFLVRPRKCLKNSAEVEVIEVFDSERFSIPSCPELATESVGSLVGYEAMCLPGRIYRIPNGIVVREREEVFSSKRILFDDFTTQRINPARTLSRSDFFPQLKLRGSVLNLSLSGLEDNYYHLLVEWLARWRIFESSNLECDWFVLPQNNSVQSDLVELLGIDQEHIIDWKSFRSLKADSILAPSFINNYMTCGLGGGYYCYPKVWMPKWSLDAVQKLSLSPALIVDCHGPEKIYISRSGASKRKVLNEIELIGSLESCGFAVVHCEELSLNAQINLFSNCKYIVAPHGAGLINLLHAQNAIKVLELHPSSYVDPSFWIACAVADVDYSYLACSVFEDLSVHPKDWDFYVDCHKVIDWVMSSCDFN